MINGFNSWFVSASWKCISSFLGKFIVWSKIKFLNSCQLGQSDTLIFQHRFNIEKGYPKCHFGFFKVSLWISTWEKVFSMCHIGFPMCHFESLLCINLIFQWVFQIEFEQWSCRSFLLEFRSFGLGEGFSHAY